MTGTITIKPQNQARRAKRRFDAVLTIEDPGMRNGLRFHRTPHPDHLVLKYEDIDFVDETIALPRIGHLQAAIDFGRAHADSDLLIHCRAGIARSTATALAVIADRLGPGRETEAVKELLRIRPEAIPNLVILDMADALLGRGGALVAAWRKVEDASPTYAWHRGDKLEIFQRRPELFAKAFAGTTGTTLRFPPDRITPQFGSWDD